jgi:OOP family OmpA-OmpF porin
MFLLAGGLALLVAGNATATNRPNAFTLSPQVGVMVFEGNQNLEPGPAGGIALGYNFNSHWGLEGVLTFTRADQKVGGDDAMITAAHLGGLYHFLPQGPLVPYLSLTFGGIQLEDDEDLLAGYGVGVKYFLSEDVALRLDLKHLFNINYRDVDKTRDYYNMLAATAGVSFQFGGAQKTALITDRDADGIIDAVDQCPDTLTGATVDETGCPLQVTPEKIADSDGDGVADNLDLCPDTPAQTVVDTRGCPAQVSLVVALPEPARTFVLDYQPNEFEVISEFTAELQRMADFIKASPGQRFIIEGHTDSIGSDESNMRLSVQRAEKVKAYLVEKMGIPAFLLDARGFGENYPVADNSTQEGRQQNRRIVIIAAPLNSFK